MANRKRCCWLLGRSGLYISFPSLLSHIKFAITFTIVPWNFNLFASLNAYTFWNACSLKLRGHVSGMKTLLPWWAGYALWWHFSFLSSFMDEGAWSCFFLPATESVHTCHLLTLRCTGDQTLTIQEGLQKLLLQFCAIRTSKGDGNCKQYRNQGSFIQLAWFQLSRGLFQAVWGAHWRSQFHQKYHTIAHVEHNLSKQRWIEPGVLWKESNL